MSAPTFSTITADDWRRMFDQIRREEQQWANAALAQIRAATAAELAKRGIEPTREESHDLLP